MAVPIRARTAWRWAINAVGFRSVYGCRIIVLPKAALAATLTGGHMSDPNPAAYRDYGADDVLECFEDAAGEPEAAAEQPTVEHQGAEHRGAEPAAEDLDAERREEALRDAAMMAPEPDFSRLRMAIAKLDAAFAAGAHKDA